MFSVGLVVAFGVFGVLMDMFGLPMTPLMLAFILGGKIESYFRMGCSYAKGSLAPFVTRPISCIFILISIFSILSPVISAWLRKKRASR